MLQHTNVQHLTTSVIWFQLASRGPECLSNQRHVLCWEYCRQEQSLHVALSVSVHQWCGTVYLAMCNRSTVLKRSRLDCQTFQQRFSINCWTSWPVAKRLWLFGLHGAIKIYFTYFFHFTHAGTNELNKKCSNSRQKCSTANLPLPTRGHLHS